MADGVIQVPPDSTGGKLDTETLTVGANTVHRQRLVVADPATAAGFSKVMNSQPAGSEYALVIRPIHPKAATSAQTSVAGSATVVTILAANTARLGATVFNDSAALLYLHLGASASTTVHTLQIPASGYYEVPSLYTGILTGLWASATGSARVVELTA